MARGGPSGAGAGSSGGGAGGVTGGAYKPRSVNDILNTVDGVRSASKDVSDSPSQRIDMGPDTPGGPGYGPKVAEASDNQS